MTNSKIIERLAKLLELSARGDEHEATLAGERAAELMAKHQLSMADITAHMRGEEAVIEDGRVDAEQGDNPSKRCELWHRVLVVGITEGLGGRTWRLQTDKYFMFWMVGPPDTVRAARYMYMALSKEISRLGRAEMKARGETNSWRRAYQRGMAMRVSERIRLARANVMQNAGTALVHVSRTQKAVDDKIASMKLKQAGGGRTRTPEAINYGYRDGEKLDIASPNTALAAGKKQLKE